MTFLRAAIRCRPGCFTCRHAKPQNQPAAFAKPIMHRPSRLLAADIPIRSASRARLYRAASREAHCQEKPGVSRRRSRSIRARGSASRPFRGTAATKGCRPTTRNQGNGQTRRRGLSVARRIAAAISAPFELMAREMKPLERAQLTRAICQERQSSPRDRANSPGVARTSRIDYPPHRLATLNHHG